MPEWHLCLDKDKHDRHLWYGLEMNSKLDGGWEYGGKVWEYEVWGMGVK